MIHDQALHSILRSQEGWDDRNFLTVSPVTLTIFVWCVCDLASASHALFTLCHIRMTRRADLLILGLDCCKSLGLEEVSGVLALLLATLRAGCFRGLVRAIRVTEVRARCVRVAVSAARALRVALRARVKLGVTDGAVVTEIVAGVKVHVGVFVTLVSVLVFVARIFVAGPAHLGGVDLRARALCAFRCLRHGSKLSDPRWMSRTSVRMFQDSLPAITFLTGFLYYSPKPRAPDLAGGS